MNLAKATAITRAAPQPELAVGSSGRRLRGHGRQLTGTVLVAGLVAAGATTALLQGGHTAQRSTGPSILASVGYRASAVKQQRLDQQLDALTESPAPEDLMSQIHAVTGTSPDATRTRTRLYQELRASR